MEGGGLGIVAHLGGVLCPAVDSDKMSLLLDRVGLVYNLFKIYCDDFVKKLQLFTFIFSNSNTLNPSFLKLFWRYLLKKQQGCIINKLESINKIKIGKY